MRNALTDIVRLQTADGKIPREIAAHYVQWAREQHYATRGRKAPAVSFQRVYLLGRTIALKAAA